MGMMMSDHVSYTLVVSVAVAVYNLSGQEGQMHCCDIIRFSIPRPAHAGAN